MQLSLLIKIFFSIILSVMTVCLQAVRGFGADFLALVGLEYLLTLIDDFCGVGDADLGGGEGVVLSSRGGGQLFGRGTLIGSGRNNSDGSMGGCADGLSVFGSA